MIGRRLFLQMSGGLLLSNMFLNCSKQNLNRKPNIIFILADDLGYGDVGCYGQQKIKTPNLDRMAAEGMKFTDAYAGSTVCAPSRCCLMTGLHTGHARIRGNGGVPLQKDDVTVATLLKNAGYKTGLIGKWGLGNAGSSGIPNRQGFDYFFGYLNQIHAHNYYPSYLWENQSKVPLEGNMVEIVQEGYAKGIGGMALQKETYSHDLFTEKVLEFITSHQNDPFFLYLPYTIPHANNEASHFDRHGMEVPDYGQYKEKDWPEPQKGLASMITRMDEDIGHILAKLAELKIDKNTIVFFSSDNGPHQEGRNDPGFFNSNGPLRGIKRDLYEGGIRVPFVVRWPGKIKANTKSDHMTAFWDFLPTCAELAGHSSPEWVDGISLFPVLTNNEKEKHEYLYWEFPAQGGKRAIRIGSWKGVQLHVSKDPDGPIELYNLENDIGESNDVADEHPDIVERIRKMMQSVRTKSKSFSLFG